MGLTRRHAATAPLYRESLSIQAASSWRRSCEPLLTEAAVDNLPHGVRVRWRGEAVWIGEHADDDQHTGCKSVMQFSQVGAVQ